MSVIFAQNSGTLLETRQVRRMSGLKDFHMVEKYGINLILRKMGN